MSHLMAFEKDGTYHLSIAFLLSLFHSNFRITGREKPLKFIKLYQSKMSSSLVNSRVAMSYFYSDTVIYESKFEVFDYIMNKLFTSSFKFGLKDSA